MMPKSDCPSTAAPIDLRRSAGWRAFGRRFVWAAGARLGSWAGPLLGISATFVIWFGAFYFIDGERQQTKATAVQISANLTRAFEEQLIRAIRAVDQTLLYVRDSYAKDPAQFDISRWARSNQFLTDFTFQVSVIDKDGLVVASSLEAAVARIDISDREHFQVQKQREVDELFISAPIVVRVSGKTSIQMTRRINAADGSFDGVVVVAVSPDYLARFYDTIDVGEHGTVTLLSTDGVILAQSPTGDSLGKSVRNTQWFEAMSTSQAGTVTTDSAIDGMPRMLTYRQVRAYPLYVVVGLARDDVFSVFEQNRMNYVLTASFLSLCLLAMTIVIVRHQRGIVEARDAAQSGTRARSEFLAMMSHEIRTPMNGVIGMAELLLDSGLRDEQVKLADTLRDSAEVLLQIINDVLDFSKLEAGRLELEKIPFAVDDLVQGVVALLAPRGRTQNIACTATVAPEVPRWVNGDPARVRQVLLNLVGNAVKFTKTGGVSVVVDVVPSPMPNRTRLMFRVTDTGIGIPADAIGLLFREFSQLDGSISRRFGGTGLGLAICKRLVGLMGGEIGVESRLGHGSSFHFAIDVEAQAAPSTEPAEERHASPSIVAGDGSVAATSLCVLVAEDNLTNQLVIRKLLAVLGVEADIAINGVDAVAACAAKRYDLILMDVMMPEMDGLAATRAIRRSPGPNNRTCIVALTANAMAEDRKICLAAGMDDFIAKPVTRKALAAVIDRTVDGAAAGPPAVADRTADFDAAVYAGLSDALGTEDAVMVLKTFLTDAMQRIDGLVRAVERDDLKAAAAEAHALKSSAATVGFMRLSELARDLEAAAKGAPGGIPAELVAAMAETYMRASQRAEHHVASDRTAITAAIG